VITHNPNEPTPIPKMIIMQNLMVLPLNCWKYNER